MAWEKLAPRERPLYDNKSYIMFSSTQIVFSAKFLRESDVQYLRLTGEKIYINVYVDKTAKKIGFEFVLEFNSAHSNLLHFQKYGWTGYISIYRLIKQYPELKDITLSLQPNSRKFAPVKEGNLWVIDLSKYWR